jgi:hypothetical protein
MVASQVCRTDERKCKKQSEVHNNGHGNIADPLDLPLGRRPWESADAFFAALS